MNCISINYKLADITVRKNFVFNDEEQNKIIRYLLDNKIVEQCVLLCTCNRTELYYRSDIPAEEEIFRLLSDMSGVEKNSIPEYSMRFAGSSALNHLFRVACGIDSMVLGEDEILGQTKDAYAMSVKLGAALYEFNMIFQAAIACAKKIKTQTPLSKTSVSVATLAANEAAYCKENPNIMVIGASGKIGGTVVKNLLSYKNVKVCVTVRQHSPVCSFIDNPRLTVIKYSERYNAINDIDCVISATSGPHYTITASKLGEIESVGKKRLFIDLAMPQDIDSAVSDLKNAVLHNLDYFRTVADNNSEIKLSSVQTAEHIIEQEIDDLQKNLIFRDFLPYMDSIKEHIYEKSFDKIMYDLKQKLSAREFKIFTDTLMKLN